MIQSFDVSAQHLSLPSIDGPKTPLSKTLNNSERPKKAFIPNKVSIAGFLTLYHLPPISITLALVCLYNVHIRWGHLNNEQLSLLQFAAKGHETLILVSLTNILMHRIRYGLLLDDGGVPLGFLSAPFNVGSPIQYFLSWELWAPLFRPEPKTRAARNGTQMMGLAIVIAIILSVSIAPLSAIAIIPRAGWWQVFEPLGQLGNGTIYYLGGSHFETHFDSDEPHTHYYTYDDTFAGKLKGLTAFARHLPLPNTLSNTQQIANVSFSKYHLAQLVSLTMDAPRLSSADKNFVAVATTPMVAVVKLIDQNMYDRPKDVLITSRQKFLDINTSVRWDSLDRPTREDRWRKFHAAPSSRWKQPIVAVECVTNDTDGDSSTFRFNTNISDKEVFLSTRNNNEFKDFLWNARRKKGVYPEVEYMILHPSDGSGSPPSASILFLATAPSIDKEVGLALCQIHSRWVEADTWLEQGKPSVQTHLDFPLFDIEAHFDEVHSEGPIRLSKEWLNAVSHDWIWKSPMSKTAYQDIIDFCTEKELVRDLYVISSCLSFSLSLYITDLLSQTNYTSIYNEDVTDNVPPTSKEIIIHQEYFIGGYGYSWHSSRTIPLAFSVLLLHVLIAFAHMVTVLWSRHPWYSSSWSSFGQMMVLALRSKAPEDLGSVGAGVSSSETWNKSVSIRVDAEDRLEMILQDEKGVVSQNQQVNSGSEEAGRDTGLSFARPGVKYH